jgi:hypothetical protein
MRAPLQNFMFVLADVGQPWIPPAGDIKMFRNLEQRDLMQFVDYREVLPAKDRVRRSRITDAGRAALAELTSQTVDAATS